MVASDTPSYQIGSLCSVKIDNETYPAIYLEHINSYHVVYVRHLDSTYRAKSVGDYEPEDVKERVNNVEYQYMESPAYFRKGTQLAIKWGNNAYAIGEGLKVIVEPNEKVDKIVCSLRT